MNSDGLTDGIGKGLSPLKMPLNARNLNDKRILRPFLPIENLILKHGGHLLRQNQNFGTLIDRHGRSSATPGNPVERIERLSPIDGNAPINTNELERENNLALANHKVFQSSPAPRFTGL